jgi:hypothetical protein
MKKIFCFLLLFLPAIACAVSSGTFYVNQWGTGNYTTLSAAEAGLRGNLGATCYIIITGSWTVSDGGATFTNAWMTYSTAPIIIQAQGLARHAGIYNNLCHRIESTNSFAEGITLNVGTSFYVYADGLQVYLPYIAFRNNGSPGIYSISNCIAKRGKGGSGNTARFNYTAGTPNSLTKIYNNIAHNWDAFLENTLTDADTFYVYNNTIMNGYSNPTANITNGCHYWWNNIVNSTNTCFRVTSPRIWNHGYNISNDTTSPDASFRSLTVSLSNPATEYFLLTSTDTAAFTKGINLSTFSFFVAGSNTDIRGRARQPVRWSIGADDNRGGTFYVNQNSGIDYTTLQTAETGLQNTLDTTCYILITGSWTVADPIVNFDGWTTFSTAPVIITVSSGSRHSGSWNDTKYRIRSAADYQYGITFTTIKNIYIDGVQIDISGYYNLRGVIDSDITNTNTFRQLSNCLIRGSSNYANHMGIQYNHTGVYRWIIYNNIIYNCGNIGMYLPSYGTNFSTSIIYNNTVSSCNVGILMSSGWLEPLALYFKNNLVQKCNNNCYDFTSYSGAGVSTQSYNVSSDTTSPNSNYRSQISSFVAYQNYNFHLLAADTTAYQRGVNLTADTIFPFSTDIDGETRPTLWAIGADDIPAAAPAAPARRRKSIVIYSE